MTRLTIRPIGDEKDRLTANTGLVNWHYNGTPVADELQGASDVVPVWLFQFPLIEETKMREYLVRIFMTMFRMNRDKAVEWLCKDRISIPQAHIELSE